MLDSAPNCGTSNPKPPSCLGHRNPVVANVYHGTIPLAIFHGNWRKYTPSGNAEYPIFCSKSCAAVAASSLATAALVVALTLAGAVLLRFLVLLVLLVLLR